MLEVMRKLRDKGAFDIIAGTFFIKFATFLGSIFLVRVLSKSDYGTFGYVENLYNYALLFAGYGLNNAVFRYVVLGESKEEKYSVFRYVVVQGTRFNIVLVVGLVVVSFFYPYPENFSQAALLLPIMLLALPFQYLCDSATFTLRALFLNRSYAVAACCFVVVLVGARLFFAQQGGVQFAVVVQPLVCVAVAAVLILYVRARLRPDAKNSILPLFCKKREATKYSLQYMVTNGIWAMFMLNDIFLLGLLMGDPAIVADYKVAYVLPAALALISTSFGVFISPYFVKNEKNRAWVWRNYKKVLIATIGVIGVFSIFLAVLAKPLISVLYGDSYVEIAPLMHTLLLAAFLNNGIRYTSANLFAAMGEIRYNMVVSFGGLLLQLILNLILIPYFGVYGAAYTSVFVYGVMALVITTLFICKYR